MGLRPVVQRRRRNYQSKQVERIRMDSQFNAHEVFEIAEQVERNGVRFYRAAAKLFEDTRIRKMFNNLAVWEAKHEEVFAEMRSRLGVQEAGPASSEAKETLSEARVMAGLAVFGIKPEPGEKLSGKESRAEVLRMAVEREKDSIVFYTGLKDFVPTEADKAKVDEIIKEEMRHIRILGQSAAETP
jgi:rubrerythrin